MTNVKPNSIGRAVDHLHAKNAGGEHGTGFCRTGFCRACADVYLALNVLSGTQLLDIVREFHADLLVEGDPRVG